jgi:predicted PurR-regulated permease PerM
MTTLPAHPDESPPGKHSDTKAAMSPHSNAPVVNYPTLIAVVATVAALYFGKDIFLPLAVAVLLTFALAPVVSWLRRFRMPKVAAVLAVVI